MNQVDEGLWIGDIQDVRESPTDRFDRVVTVCQDSVADNVGCSYNHFNMSDGEADGYGGECNSDIFFGAAHTVFTAVRDGETVLVHCHVGRSRSGAVVTAVYARLNNISYQEALYEVQQQRPIVNPNEILNDLGREYVNVHSGGHLDNVEPGAGCTEIWEHISNG